MASNSSLRRGLAVCAAIGTSAALLASPGIAASGGKFSGKSSQNRPVSFKLRGGKVRAFTGGVTMYCTQSGYQFNAAIPPKPMKVRGGKFSYKGRDKKDSVDIVIKGKIKGAKASGRLEMTDSTYFASSGTFDTCNGKSTWKAKKG
jgi:hypothetical protein